MDSLDWTHDQRFPVQGHILNFDGDALSTCPLHRQKVWVGKLVWLFINFQFYGV